MGVWGKLLHKGKSMYYKRITYLDKIKNKKIKQSKHSDLSFDCLAGNSFIKKTIGTTASILESETKLNSQRYMQRANLRQKKLQKLLEFYIAIKDESRVSELREIIELRFPKGGLKEDRTLRKVARKRIKLSKRKVRPNTRYENYIKSPLWDNVKKEYWKTHDRKCRACDCFERIHLHHAFYSERGKETHDHLYALCEKCHDMFHEKIGKTKKDMIAETEEFIRESRNIMK